jgi:hypothetical protein
MALIRTMLSWARSGPGVASTILAFGLGLVAATPATAAQWPSLTLPELCELSDDIVHARVLSQEAYLGERGWIFTRYELEVLDRVLPTADPATRLTLEQPGGVLGERRQSVSGIQHFDEGEELIVFSGTAANGRRVALAGPRGSLRVVSGELPGLKAAFPELDIVEPELFLNHVRRVLDPTSGPQQ